MSPEGTTSFQTIRRSLAGAGFLIGTATLIAQFPLTMSLSMEGGRTAFGSAVFFFSFFTILSNILAVLCLLAVLLGDGGGPAFFRKPQVQSAVALYMLVVAIIYIAILEGLWAPTGLMRVLDTLLHYVMPAIFLAYWLIFVAKGTLAYADLPKILAFPFFYAAYVMIRGSLTGEYPYPIMNAAKLGYPTALLNTAFIFILFLVLGLALVAYDRWAGRGSGTTPSG